MLAKGRRKTYAYCIFIIAALPSNDYSKASGRNQS